MCHCIKYIYNKHISLNTLLKRCKHLITFIKCTFAPCCANIHSESVFSCWVKVINHHLWISGVGNSFVNTCSLPRGLISYKVHGKPPCLMEGEWGPTDKGSSVVADPLKLHIANLGSGSCNKSKNIYMIKQRGCNQETTERRTSETSAMLTL